MMVLLPSDIGSGHQFLVRVAEDCRHLELDPESGHHDCTW